MTIEEIKAELAKGDTLPKEQQDALWNAIQALGEPHRSSLVSAYLRRFPGDLIDRMFDGE